MSASKETSTPVRAEKRIAGTPRMARRPKPRKFYLVQFKAFATASGKEHLNEKEVFGEGWPKTFAPPGLFDRGFRKYPVVPKFLVSKRLGRMPPDISYYHAYWFVSDRAKGVLSELSDIDFEFMALDIKVDPGQEPLSFWLCEVMTMLDAVDDSGSKVIVKQNDMGKPLYHITSDMMLKFREDIVGEHHAFHLNNNFSHIVCDDTFRQAIKDAGLTGLRFQDLSGA